MESYPLHWPMGYQRTRSRKRSGFKQTMDGAQRFLHNEIRKLGARKLIVSSNIPLRNDGGMYSAYMNKRLDDPGVAIYFELKGKQISMCCDQYISVWENVYALGKGIEALRGMDRWGVSDFLDRAFTGFTALPEPAQVQKREWWVVMDYQRKPNNAVWDWAGVEAQYKSLAKKLHPDVTGGSTEKFQELVEAFDQAKKYFGR